MMAETAISTPGLSRVFTNKELTAGTFDHVVLNMDPSADPSRLKVVFFWGADCPNCADAKNHLSAMADELTALPADFYSVNAYEQMELTTRFGLYGIPVFLFFKRGRLISKITSFPTRAEFLAALRRSV